MSEESQDNEKKRELYDLKLTKYDLIHLRDLFSILMPPHLSKTLSQDLAVKEGRPLVEAHLWNKIAEACSYASVQLDENAPDFLLGVSGIPEIGVFRMAESPEDLDDDSETPVTLPFLSDEK